MSVSSSQVMGAACAWIRPRTIKHDMDRLCRSRHSARLANAGPHLLLAHRAELEMADDSVLVDKESAGKAEHAVAERRLSVGVKDRLKAVEAERVEEGARFVAWLQEIDFEHDDVGLARGDALQR